MPKFRKKPVVIEAERVDELLHNFQHNWNALPNWVKDAYKARTVCTITDKEFTVRTLEGDMTATKQDMLIKGVSNEIYPCKITIFQNTYDPID